MKYKETPPDSLSVKMYIATAGIGAIAGAVCGVHEDLSAHASAFKDAVAGGACGAVIGGIYGASISRLAVYEGEPIDKPPSYEGPADRFIDGVLEFFRADPA
ncbi:MAG: hypothetical protein GW778_01880 [Alphaproteobacteria bacterium]|nr:hypothetical protein [Alphaproteobacteria bacterium]